MKNQTIAILVIAILGVGGYFAYKTKFWVKVPEFSKDEAIIIITNSGNSSNSNNSLVALEENYLKEWAKAIYRNQTNFQYNGKNYIVKGGKALK